MRPATHLSKSHYIKGKQCAKALWYYYHRKDLLPALDGASQARFDTGREVGELARQYFTDGALVECQPWEIEQSLQLTQTLVQQGASIIYEAAARAADGTYARADILAKTDADSWSLIEVKSSTGVKDYHLDDAAVQYYVFTQAGYRIDKFMILHINNAYARYGALSVSDLFSQTDITDLVLAQQHSIPALLASLHGLMTSPEEPAVSIGTHCSAPFDCDYQHHCWKDVPEYSVFNVLQGKKAFEIAATTGSYFVKDLPQAHMPKGAKAIDVQCHLEDRIHVDKAKLQAFLTLLDFPLYYLDFETIGPAIPFYDGTKPYQQIPFQFSLHIEYAADRLESKGYLHWQRTDPREEFVKHLLKQCAGSGPIIVYNKAFEAGCITALAEVFPQHATALLALNERMVDLLVPFRQRWLYHPKQNGSASIKAVLPAFTGKSYEELDITNGGAASERYFAYMQGKLTRQEGDKLYSDLIAYCELDTYAMVELMRIAKRLAA